jgi:uncharacterized protein
MHKKNDKMKYLSILLCLCLLGCKQFSQNGYERITDELLFKSINVTALNKKKNNHLELFMTAVMYQEGRGTDKDIGKALSIYSLLIDEGHYPAMVNKAWCYLNGIGVNKNIDQAMTLYRLAAYEGNRVVAQEVLAGIYINNHNLSAAFSLYTIAYESHRSDIAALELGKIALMSDWGKRDEELAQQYFRSVKEGEYYPESQFQLGEIDYVTHNNPERALVYYENASRFDYGPAIARIGTFMELGLAGLDINIKQAYDAYLKSYENGFLPSAFDLARFYENGIQVDVDKKRALELYRIASGGSDPRANDRLGKAFFFGELSLNEDNEQAYHYFSRAEKEGIVDAMAYVGWMCLNGFGVEQNTQKGKDLLEHAVESNSSTAQNYLGRAYFKEIGGIKQNVKKSYQLHKKAAKQGNKNSKEWVDYLEYWYSDIL